MLLVAVLAGLFLKDNLTDGPRMLHSLLGKLAGFISIVVAVRTMQLRSEKSWKILAWSALAATFFAGFSGIMLKETSNYDMTFMMMRLGGTLALLFSVALLVKISKADKK